MHLLRGLAALVLVAAALFLDGLGTLGVMATVIGAVLLLRGCPMCWLMGLFETMAKARGKSAPGA